MPCVTKSGLVHVHALLKKRVWRDLKRRAGKKSISATIEAHLIRSLADPTEPPDTPTGKYQADND